MRDYKKYDVWIKAHELVKDIYQATSALPKDEKFGLTSQIRRASVSIPTNIVEGSGRKTDADFTRFLYIAAASAAEVEYLLELAKELSFLNTPQTNDLIRRTNRIRRMLYRFIQSITSS